MTDEQFEHLMRRLEIISLLLKILVRELAAVEIEIEPEAVDSTPLP